MVGIVIPAEAGIQRGKEKGNICFCYDYAFFLETSIKE